ncbi:hypothetical protein FA10DRAFT_285352 [Acaromyces ingoldii]|uniref:NAD(P)-binding domain-containing protein n=1 Tax=Acaromyces ingoldii TaxID=215250 RepID=A0A316YTV7_9BASI|nr:hypothetical protein FA10DRAFT_285352 [Acaromyces ingoldii]PWN92486.1 hypothetical protein FA10DRAFT_285352 [Acaromyces ingoldii]
MAQDSHPQRIAMLGATRGCGLEALLILLQHTNTTVHVLVRDPSAFRAALSERLPSAAEYESKGRLVVAKGDAMVTSDVVSFLTAAQEDLTHVVTSLGAKPVISGLTALFKPVQLSQPDICQRTMAVLLDALRQLKEVPHLVVVSSNGIAKQSHSKLPLALKPLYGYYLRVAHDDKHEMETKIHSAYGLQSPAFNPSPRKAAAASETAKLDPSKLTIVRPSLLTDGAARGKIRASTNGMDLRSAYTASRADVGLFLVDQVIRPAKTTSDAPHIDVQFEAGGRPSDAVSIKDGSKWEQGIVLAY